MKRLMALVMTVTLMSGIIGINVNAAQLSTEKVVKLDAAEQEYQEFLKTYTDSSRKAHTFDIDEYMALGDRIDEAEQKLESTDSKISRNELQLQQERLQQDKLQYEAIRDQFVVFIPESEMASRAAYTPGESTRIMYKTGWSTSYNDDDFEGEMANFANQTVGAFLNFAHPAVGLLYSAFNAVIGFSDVYDYTDTKIQYTKDVILTEKVIQVYYPGNSLAGPDGWIDDVVIAQRRTTSGEVEVRYRKGTSVRTTDEINLGTIEDQYNKYYYNNTYLKDVAKSVFDGAIGYFPRLYRHNASGHHFYKYDKSSMFEYNDWVFRL